MFTRGKEPIDALYNELQLGVENDRRNNDAENEQNKVGANEVENVKLQFEQAISQAVQTQKLSASQGAIESSGFSCHDEQFQGKETGPAHDKQTQAKKNNPTNNELGCEANYESSDDLLACQKLINLQENDDFSEGDLRLEEAQHDFKSNEKENDTSIEKFVEDDVEQDMNTSCSENNETKETVQVTTQDAFDVDNQARKIPVNIDAGDDFVKPQIKDGKVELMPTPSDDVEVDDTAAKCLDNLEENISNVISEYDRCHDNQRYDEFSTSSLENSLAVHALQVQENIDKNDKNVLPADIEATCLLTKDDTSTVTTEVKIIGKMNDVCMEMEDISSMEDKTSIVPELLGNVEALQLGKMFENDAGPGSISDGVLRMTLSYSAADTRNLQTEDIIKNDKKSCRKQSFLLETHVNTNDGIPVIDLNEEFLLLTSTLIKDIAKETNYYTVNEKILNSTVSRTSLWNATSGEQSSLKRRSNSMGNCREELTLSPNHLENLHSLAVSKNQQTRRTSESPSHDGDASSMSSYRYYRSRHNSSFRRDGPCTVVFQDLCDVIPDEDVKDSVSHMEFMENGSKRLDSMAHFWLMHSMLSITGMIIFSLKNFEEFDYKKFAFTAVQGVVIVFATAYTITYYARGDLPSWFVIYTLPFLGMHFYALGLQIHSVKERDNFKTFLQSFKQLQFENSRYYSLGPVISLVYSLLNYGLLFIVMPSEAYGITVALLPSIFNPGMYDTYMIMIARALINSYKLIEEEAKRTKRWTAKNSRIFERKLRGLYQAITHFNQTFSKNLLSRRTLFLFQLLANTYVITAVTNFQEMCLLLFICTLIPCIEILIRLYILCSQGDQLIEQYKKVHHALLKIYYSMNGTEKLKTGRSYSRAAESRASFVKVHNDEKSASSTMENFTSPTKLLNEEANDAKFPLSSSTSSNLTGMGNDELRESSVEQASYTEGFENDIDFKNVNNHSKQLNNDNTMGCTDIDSSFIAKSNSNEYIKNEITSTDHCHDPDTSRNCQECLEVDLSAMKSCNTSFTNKFKASIECKEKNSIALDPEKMIHISTTSNINADKEHECIKSGCAAKVGQSLDSKDVVRECDNRLSSKLETIDDKDQASSSKINVTEIVNESDTRKTSAMEQGLLTSWLELNDVEIRKLDSSLHLNHQDSSTSLDSPYTKGNVQDDCPGKSNVEIEVDAAEDHLVHTLPKLKFEGNIFENSNHSETPLTDTNIFKIPQIVISDVDCTSYSMENESSVLTLAFTQNLPNPILFNTHSSALQPPPIIRPDDATINTKNLADKCPFQKIILKEKCPFSDNLSKKQHNEGITNPENKQSNLTDGSEKLLLSSNEVNSGKLKYLTPKEAVVPDYETDENNEVSSLKSVYVDVKSIRSYLLTELCSTGGHNNTSQEPATTTDVKQIVHNPQASVSDTKLSKKYLHPEEAARKKIYGNVCEFNFGERQKRKDAAKRRHSRARRVNAKQRLAALLGRLEFRHAEMRISGHGRLGSESLVSLLSVTITFIAVLLQILPDRPLGSSAIHGCYDSCFYYKD